jgi:hypothetical protein
LWSYGTVAFWSSSPISRSWNSLTVFALRFSLESGPCLSGARRSIGLSGKTVSSRWGTEADMTAISPGRTWRMLLCLLIAFTEAGNTRNESGVNADYTQCTTQARYTNGHRIETGRLEGDAKDGDGEGSLAGMLVWPPLEGQVTPERRSLDPGIRLQSTNQGDRILVFPSAILPPPFSQPNFLPLTTPSFPKPIPPNVYPTFPPSPLPILPPPALNSFGP